MTDNLLVLQADGTTKTASYSPGNGVTINGAQRSRALYARVRYRSGNASTATARAQFKIQHSDDDSTYNDHVVDADQTITLPTSGNASGTIFLPIATDKKYVRLTLTITNDSSSARTITYGAEIVIGKV